jgi:LytR cell envelope-related transcriptional attenuator
MSNSTRPGGYDERLVVPLEASRRGAHRARINPLMSALPVLAVVLVVLAVVGVAYTLFVKGSNSNDDTATGTVPATSAPAGSAPTTTAPGGASSSTKPATSPSASSSTAAATVNKAASFSVYNGSVNQVPGLAKKANSTLNGAGFTKGGVVSGNPPVDRSRTTRIYYATSADKATAEALKDALGGGSVRLNPTVAARGLVVVVGDNYNG